MTPPLADNLGAIAQVEVWITWDDVEDLDALDAYLSTLGVKAIERALARDLRTPTMVRADVRSVHARERETDGTTSSALHWTMGGRE